MNTGLCKGFGYVTIHVDEEKTLSRCLKVYNGTKWKGNVLRVEIAKEHYMDKMRREWDMERQQIEQLEEDILEVEEREEEVEDSTPSTLYICKERHPEMICVQVDLLEPFSTVNASGDSIQRRHLCFDNVDVAFEEEWQKKILGCQEAQISWECCSGSWRGELSDDDKEEEEEEEEKVVEKVVKVHKENNSSSEEEESSSDEEDDSDTLVELGRAHSIHARKLRKRHWRRRTRKETERKSRQFYHLTRWLEK